MNRALLIGVPNDHSERKFDPTPSLDAMAALLRDLGDWSISRLEGPSQTSRAGLLEALTQLEAAVGAHDCVLFYFAGHGGIVEIVDLPPPLGGRQVFYVATTKVDQTPLHGVLDIELSLALARIDRVCENVTAILDCCYSARTVRGPSWELPTSPPWLRTLSEQLPERSTDSLLHPTSHPRIVRLAGSSSLGRSFTDRGALGRLTSAFVEVVRDAKLEIDRLTWDAVLHRARERAIWRLGCEEQWVTLAGPRQRLLLSRRAAPLPRTVGFVPDERGGGWIRAGAIQGVRVGDEWGLAELTLDDELRPRWCARMRVTAVDLNRAALEVIDAGDRDRLVLGASAWLCSAASRERVRVRGQTSLYEAVAGSTWLSSDDAEPFAELLAGDGTVDVRTVDDRFAAAQFSDDALGLAAAIERLEAWARARVLLSVAASFDATEPLISVQLVSDHAEGARLHVGARLRLVIECTSKSESWFVNAIMIDVAGCPVLLDPAEPDGRELRPGQRETIGEHPHRRLQGLPLHWVDGIALAPRRVDVIVLASRRPIELGHLVGIPRDVAPRRRARTRGHLAQPRPRTGPELSHAWSATRLQFELDPAPR